MDEINQQYPCEALGIPEHLWQLDKETNPNFENDELLYRRVRNPIPLVEYLEDVELEKRVSSEIFELKDDSYNRSSLSNSQDVLINNQGESMEGYGIISLKVGDLYLNEPVNLNGREHVVSFVPIHDPVKCNYAHTILEYQIDGQKASNPRPAKTVRTILRRKLIRLMKLEKNAIMQ